MKETATLIFCLLIASNCFAQTQDIETATTPKQFRTLARKIEATTNEEYFSAREDIAKKAIAVAEEDLKTTDAEDLLHWILRGKTKSQTAHKAAKYLIEHHATSPRSVRNLLSYAQAPSACTPELFRGFAKADLPDELRWIVSACTAIHQKSLLLIADEMAVNHGAVSRFYSTLGQELADKLAKEDLGAYESRVIAAFKLLSKQHGKQSMGGMRVDELSEGAIFELDHLRLGKTATGLSGASVSGDTIDLETFRGKVVLVDFWATWCVPCVMTLPILQSLHDELDESKFRIIGVSANTDKKKLSQFINEHDLQWPNIFDRDSVLQKRWQSLSLPSYYVLDKSGKVRYRGDNHALAAAVVKSLLGVAPEGTLPVDVIARSIIDSLDANKDGRLQQAEVPDEMKAGLNQADSDNDGMLSFNELLSHLKNGTVTTETKSYPQRSDRTKP